MNRETKIVLLILGLVFGSISVACAGCGGIFVYFWGEMEDDIAHQIRENPVVVEHLGEVSSCEMDLSASFDEEDVESFWFDVEGARGKGRVRVTSVTNDAGSEDVVAGELVTPEGTWDLFAPGEEGH